MAFFEEFQHCCMDEECCKPEPPKDAFILGEDGFVRHFQGYWDEQGNLNGSFPKILGTFRIAKKTEAKPNGVLTCIGLSEPYRGFTLAEDECLIRVLKI